MILFYPLNNPCKNEFWSKFRSDRNNLISIEIFFDWNQFLWSENISKNFLLIMSTYFFLGSFWISLRLTKKIRSEKYRNYHYHWLRVTSEREHYRLHRKDGLKMYNLPAKKKNSPGKIYTSSISSLLCSRHIYPNRKINIQLANFPLFRVSLQVN